MFSRLSQALCLKRKYLVTPGDLFHLENNVIRYRDMHLEKASDLSSVEASFLDLQEGYSSKSCECVTRKTNFSTTDFERKTRCFFSSCRREGKAGKSNVEQQTALIMDRHRVLSFFLIHRTDIRAYLLFLKPAQDLSPINTWGVSQGATLPAAVSFRDREQDKNQDKIPGIFRCI